MYGSQINIFNGAYYLLKKKLILVADNYHGPWQWCIYGVRFQGDQSSLPKAVHNVQHFLES